MARCPASSGQSFSRPRQPGWRSRTPAPAALLSPHQDTQTHPWDVPVTWGSPVTWAGPPVATCRELILLRRKNRADYCPNSVGFNKIMKSWVRARETKKKCHVATLPKHPSDFLELVLLAQQCPPLGPNPAVFGGQAPTKRNITKPKSTTTTSRMSRQRTSSCLAQSQV